MITVTQRNIDDGEEKICSKCPVALAIQDYYGFPVFVTQDRVFHVNRSEHGDIIPGKTIGNLPYDVTEKIIEFDKGFGMTPFSFELT